MLNLDQTMGTIGKIVSHSPMFGKPIAAPTTARCLQMLTIQVWVRARHAIKACEISHLHIGQPKGYVWPTRCLTQSGCCVPTA